jgi:hypothetical protein
MKPLIQTRHNQMQNLNGNNNSNNNCRNFIPPEAWAQIPEDVRKMLYSSDNTNNNSNQPNNRTVLLKRLVSL